MKHTPYIIVALFLAACSQTPDNTKKPQEYSMFNENLITANKYLVKQDIEQINNYIKRRNWQMDTADGGIRYMITKHGEGLSVEQDPNVILNYRIELLDGTLCYDSQTDGKQNLVAGSSEMIVGLIKAFKFLRHGDEAVLILPPHAAKGLVGDLNKIPPHSVIVYYLGIE
ncbi:MAG: FKBP-type peptidyl-prolyl cis-trans isomerase [Bacteroidales bacterium]|nr:FKBP-type peptidyl-prolyl cis-trans isomerase [Bacteroidales bacterium]